MDRKTSVWSFFTKKGGWMASCNTCKNDYSYKASVSNLRKHWMNKHGKPSDLSEHSSDNEVESDEEEEKVFTKKKPFATWNYYEILDSDKYEANCKLCGKNIPYESVSDLRKHVQEHGEEPMNSDDDEVDEVEPEVQKKKNRQRSKVWKYFKNVDSESKMALCLLCRNMFNYGATISNLGKHLKRKHPEVLPLDKEDDSKKLIISSNGQLFEVETDTVQEENDNDNEPVEMDTIYLEDLDDSMDQLTNTEHFNSTKLLTTSSLKKKQPIIPRKSISTRLFSARTKEQFKRSVNTCSEEELPRKRITSNSPNTMSSLDYFGQYVVSLLKELPKTVSDQLQSEIIKQILNSKMALESQTTPAKYGITINHNDSQSVVPEAVNYTVVQSNDISEKSEE